MRPPSEIHISVTSPALHGTCSASLVRRNVEVSKSMTASLSLQADAIPTFGTRVWPAVGPPS
jgi:hypothetical protein